MPSTTSKKNCTTDEIKDDRLLEMEKKNKELEEKLDLILNMLQSKPQNSEPKVVKKKSEPTIDSVVPDEPLSNKNIRVMSLCYGSLNLNDGTRVALHFDNFGQIKTCLYSTLTSIVNTDTSFAEQGKFYICDKDAVYYLGLYEAYKTIFDFETITNICDYSEEEIENIVNNMNESQKRVLVQNIVTRMSDGDKFDLNKINIISKSTNIDINSEFGEYQRVMGLIKK